MTYGAWQMKASWQIEDDFRFITNSSKSALNALQNKTIFITGGTGFIGKWFLDSILYANAHLSSNIRLIILTRDPSKFLSQRPDLANTDSVQLIEGDVNANLPRAFKVKIDYLVHAATDASADLNENNPLLMFDTVVMGTRNILQFCVDQGIKRILYLSSGAVYGRQPAGISFVGEKDLCGPDCLDARLTYGEAKRAAEMLCAIYIKQHQLNISTARIFALLGPFLNLDIHFAAGNFIKDAMAKKKIIIKGNGLPERSYLYPADLTIFLIHLLVFGANGSGYNLGSERGVSIKDLAFLISEKLGGAGVEVLGSEDLGWNVGRYVPNVSKINNEFGLKPVVSLEEAILRTAVWNGWERK